MNPDDVMVMSSEVISALACDFKFSKTSLRFKIRACALKKTIRGAHESVQLCCIVGIVGKYSLF